MQYVVYIVLAEQVWQHSCGNKYDVVPLSGSAASQGRRDMMEDAHVAIDCLWLTQPTLDRNSHWALYGVYDGHGGQLAKGSVALSDMHHTGVESARLASKVSVVHGMDFSQLTIRSYYIASLWMILLSQMVIF